MEDSRVKKNKKNILLPFFQLYSIERKEDAKDSQLLEGQKRDSFKLTVLGHCCLTTIMIIGSILLNAGMFSFAIIQEENWLNYDNFKKNTETAKLHASNINASLAEKERMVEQFMLLQARIETHAKVMGLFFTLNFVSLGTIIPATGAMTISLFFITKSGWSETNNAIINIFVVSSGLLIFHSNAILVFKFNENANINARLYSDYSQISSTMVSYWAIQPVSSNAPPVEEFIQKIDGELSRLGKISLDFDSDRIAKMQQPLDVFGGISK